MRRSRFLALLLATGPIAALGFGLYSLLRPDESIRELGDFEGVVPVSAPLLPLKVSEDRRYLVDQKGTPFLVAGDTAWSLIAQLNSIDIDHYLTDREKKGFNSIIVNLIEHKFCNAPPKTKAGIEPFLKTGDFAAPNAAYFDFAFEVIKKANDCGIVVWLAPAYLGSLGGDEGWFQDMKKSGKPALRAYGRFLGERFRDLPNIVWVMGGDFAPPEEDRWTVTEIAEGIREKDDKHPMTAHCARGESAADTFDKAKWLDVNTTYSSEKSLIDNLRTDYQRKTKRPFVLIEAIYENEHDATPELIRRQAYGAILSGACGEFIGNSPIWHFDGPGTSKPSTTWQKALDQRGSWDMIRWRNVFVGRPWHSLRPDEKNGIITDGRGEGRSVTTTAATADGKLAISYLPSTGNKPRQITINVSGFAGPVTARWYNPTNGRHVAIEGSPLANRDSHTLKTPGDNGTKTNDWLLILETK